MFKYNCFNLPAAHYERSCTTQFSMYNYNKTLSRTRVLDWVVTENSRMTMSTQLQPDPSVMMMGLWRKSTLALTQITKRAASILTHLLTTLRGY